jgi:hypothetical protein
MYPFSVYGVVPVLNGALHSPHVSCLLSHSLRCLEVGYRTPPIVIRLDTDATSGPPYGTNAENTAS